MSTIEIAISQYFPLLKQGPSKASIKAIQELGIVKTNAQAAKAVGNILVGLASVFSNLDSGGDIVGEHAFDSAILAFKAGRQRPRFLLNHEQRGLPIGKILDMRAVKASELPESLRREGATGGLLVEKLYFDSQRAQDALEVAKAGELGMSFGYEVIDAEPGTLDGQKVRLLNVLDLHEVSDVCFPMNKLTSAMIGKSAAEKTARLKRLRLAPAQPPTAWMRDAQMKLNRLKLDSMKHLPRKPLTRQQWANQMRLNQMKLNNIKLLT